MENHFSPERQEIKPERVTLEVSSKEEAIDSIKAFWTKMFEKEIAGGRTLKQLINVRGEDGWLETITLGDRTSVETVYDDDGEEQGFLVHFKGNRRPISEEGLKVAQALKMD